MERYEVKEPWKDSLPSCGMPGSDPNATMGDPWEKQPGECTGVGPMARKDAKGRDIADRRGKKYTPTGDFKSTNPKDLAATYRLDLTLFPGTAVAYGALGMTEGHCKYGAYNYRVKGVAVCTYLAAMKRHIERYENGEWADPKTKVPHLASILADAGILVDGHELGVILDDRPPKADVAGLLERFMENVKHLFTVFPNSPGRYTDAQHGKKEKA